MILPKPSQVLQAPIGLLKVKKFTFGSSNVMPSNSNKLLKEFFVYVPSFFSTQTKHSPPPSKKAVCTLSATLFKKSSSSGLAINLSINRKTSVVFLTVLKSTSLIFFISPLITALEKPCCESNSNCF